MIRSLTHRETPYPHFEYSDSESGDRLRIVPERGGLISQWRCNGREILYFDQLRFQDELKSIRGGIPILFPICGDLPGNILPFANSDERLNQHGFARDQPWKLTISDDQKELFLTLRDSAETLRKYPFLFSISINIKMLANTLELIIEIENNSEIEMPFSFGLHPYFSINNLSELSLSGLPEKCLNQLDMKECDIYSQIKTLSRGVDFLASPKGLLKLLDKTDGSKLHLHHYYPMDLSVVWTDPPRNMICIEPWTSPRRALLSGDRKLTLYPNEIQHLKCKYVVAN